jgi:hypothetical protein
VWIPVACGGGESKRPCEGGLVSREQRGKFDDWAFGREEKRLEKPTLLIASTLKKEFVFVTGSSIIAGFIVTRRILNLG